MLSDGSGLTARQSATALSRAGHRVEALTADPLALVRFTRHVRKVHRVPPYGDPAVGAGGREGIATHQTLLALIAAGTAGRRSLIKEVAEAVLHRGAYAHGREELAPVAGDWLSVLPLATATVAGLLGPSCARALARGAVRNYALTARGWRALLDRASDIAPSGQPAPAGR